MAGTCDDPQDSDLEEDTQTVSYQRHLLKDSDLEEDTRTVLSGALLSETPP